VDREAQRFGKPGHNATPRKEVDEKTSIETGLVYSASDQGQQLSFVTNVGDELAVEIFTGSNSGVKAPIMSGRSVAQ
jgi:hypothetical protein